MVGLLFSSITGLLVSLERIDLSAANIFSTADEVFQFWSAHRVSLVLIAVLPLMIGLATLIIPRQVGSSRLVFPKMSAFSFWVWLFGASIIIIGFLANGGVGTPEAVRCLNTCRRTFGNSWIVRRFGKSSHNDCRRPHSRHATT